MEGLVTPGVNGYLFEPKDTQDEAHNMQLLANQPDRWYKTFVLFAGVGTWPSREELAE